jgi:drug/metabolite transporter (DMT)-like permease
MSMLAAGIAWGIYSLRAKGAADPTRITAGNFVRALPFAAGLSVAMFSSLSLDRYGVLLAIASGGLASGMGYAIWYTALRGLNSTSAATVQLSVPVIAAFGGIVFLGEAITPRLLITSMAILGGIAMIAAAPSSTK